MGLWASHPSFIPREAGMPRAPSPCVPRPAHGDADCRFKEGSRAPPGGGTLLGAWRWGCPLLILQVPACTFGWPEPEGPICTQEARAHRVHLQPWRPEPRPSPSAAQPAQAASRHGSHAASPWHSPGASRPAWSQVGLRAGLSGEGTGQPGLGSCSTCHHSGVTSSRGCPHHTPRSDISRTVVAIG